MSGPNKNSKADDKDTTQARGMMGRGHGPMGMGNIEKAQDARGALTRLLGYLSNYRIHLVAIIILTIFSSLIGLAGPYLVGVAIDQIINGSGVDQLVNTSLILAGTYLLSALVSMASSWVMAIISQRSLKKLRKELFEHLQTLSIGFFDTRQTGDLMSRLTNDVDAIGRAIASNVTSLISSSISVVGIVVLMFGLNWELALTSLIMFPIMIVMTAWVGGKTRSGYKDLMMNMGILNGIIQETIGGQRVVIAFDQQESVNNKFTMTNETVRDVSIKANTYSMLAMPLMSILSNANIAIVAGVGAWMTLEGMATVGIIATFIQYSRQFANPLRQFANIYNSIQSALAGAERIFEVIDTEPKITDVSDAVGFEDFQGKVEFIDVDFEYVEGVPVLTKINLIAEPGQTIALVGPTGAGKTTIVNLLTRYYDIKGGSIKIDGVDIREIKKDDLRKQLGIVLQDVFLFSGTVMDNIRYGRLEATDEECILAAELANADSFIRRLPSGYETELSERAGNISQGQKQLISIARALVADPAILVLDEATSSVDTRTEVQIQEAFRNLMHGRTSFVIAHRLSTIRNADNVLVINDGELIERGTHDELLEKKGFYYRLYMSQFKGTNGDADFERIKPVEVPVSTPPTGMSGGMGGGRQGMGGGHGRGGGRQGMGGNPAMFMDRIMQTVKTFNDKDATTPENAKTIEELGLPPQFKMMLTHSPMGQAGIFKETNGKYYVNLEQVKQMQERFSN